MHEAKRALQLEPGHILVWGLALRHVNPALAVAGIVPNPEGQDRWSTQLRRWSTIATGSCRVILDAKILLHLFDRVAFSGPTCKVSNEQVSGTSECPAERKLFSTCHPLVAAWFALPNRWPSLTIAPRRNWWGYQ